jgi:hypothetical protein
MKAVNDKMEQYRLLAFSSRDDGNNGAFIVPFEGRELKVIVSYGMNWDHVSVSLPNRTPNWEEMSFIKDLFFDENETVIQFHPKKSEYVNNHLYCLHLWRKQDSEHELPPSILTGIK